MDNQIKTRHDAREEVFKLIFQMNQHTDDMKDLLKNLFDEHPEAQKFTDYINTTVLGICEKNDELKQIVSEHLTTGWTISRINKIPLSVLKIAIYEILYVDDVPEKVAVNEAIELMKKYGEPDGAKFVNGVLSGVLSKQGK